MSERRKIKPKVYTRAVIAISLIIVWVLSAFSGFILWLAPEVRQAGKQQLLFGITKQNWGEIHFWICVAVMVVTVLHLIIDWKALCGVIRYMTSVNRDRTGTVTHTGFFRPGRDRRNNKPHCCCRLYSTVIHGSGV